MVRGKWTLNYDEMVCLSLITKAQCLHHTSQARPGAAGWWGEMPSFPPGETCQEVDSGNESHLNHTDEVPLSASCTPSPFLGGQVSSHRPIRCSLQDITSAMENFIPAAGRSDKAAIHFEGETGCASVTVCMDMCVSVVSWNTDSMMSWLQTHTHTLQIEVTRHASTCVFVCFLYIPSALT